MVEHPYIQRHIYDPPGPGFTFISVVVAPGQEPSIKSYENRQDAEEVMRATIALLTRASKKKGFPTKKNQAK